MGLTTKLDKRRARELYKATNMLVEDNEIKEQEFYTLLNLFGVVEK
jgi:hypothetical protein